MADNEKEGRSEEEEKLTNESQNDHEISNFLPETLSRGKCGEPTWSDTLRQIVASCIVHCTVIQAGVNMAYSTVLIGGLQANNNINYSDEGASEQRLIIDKGHESWIASLVTITLPVGALIAGPLMDKFGRRTICIALCIPMMLSWILLIVSRSLAMIYAARIIAGITAGLTGVSIAYVLEITHPRVRAMLLCLNSVFVSLGILLTCLFALWLDWRRIAMIFLALNVGIFFALFSVPESPYWLVYFGKGCPEKTAKAEKSLRWLNPRTLMYEQEYSRIKEMSQNRRQNFSESASRTFLECSKDYLEELSRPIVYKPMFLLFFILLMQQLSGTYVVIFYAISVFREIGGNFGNGFDEYGALLLLGVIRFFMSLLTAFLSRTIGRRILCISSGLGMAFAMFFSAMFIYLTSFCDGNVDSSMAHQKWMLLVVVLFYVCMSTLGFAVIPWTLIGELLPISFRGVGGGIMISFAYIAMFAVVKSYPFALLAIGPQNVFFFFSVTSLIGTGIIYLFLPETLGKSFKEIENFFSSKDENEGQEKGLTAA